MVWFPTMSTGGHYTNNSFVNMMYSNMLPMMYTNYGGDFQAVTIDPFQNYTLGYAFNPIAQMSWGTGSCMTPGITPSVNVQAAENFGRNILFGELNKETSNIISQELNTLSAMKNKLQSKLKEEGISEEDKTKIQEILDKIEEKEKEVQQLKENKEIDADAAYQKANKLGTEIQELCKEAQTVLAGKTESSDKSDTDTDSAEKTDDDKKTDAATGTAGDDNKTEDAADKKTDEKQGAKGNDKDSKTVDQKAEEAGYRKTWGSGIYYSETEKKHYEYDSETGEFKVIEGLVFAGKDGSRRYETKNQDGTYNSITYNKDGVITEMQARAHNTKYCYTDKEKAAKQLGLRTTWDSKKEIYYSETYRLHFAWDNNKHEFVARPEISQMNPNSYFGTDGKLHERNGNIVKDQPKKEVTVQNMPTDEMRELVNAGQ